MDWLKIFMGLVLLTISALWIDLSLHLPFPSFARVARVGPAHFPLLVASILALLTIIWLAREHHKKIGRKRGLRGEAHPLVPGVRGIHNHPASLGIRSQHFSFSDRSGGE